MGILEKNLGDQVPLANARGAVLTVQNAQASQNALTLSLTNQKLFCRITIRYIQPIGECLTACCYETENDDLW